MTTRTSKLVVNGKEYNYPLYEPISYDQVWLLAHSKHKGAIPKGYDITYRMRTGDVEQRGVLNCGMSVAVLENAIFNCYLTGDA